MSDQKAPATTPSSIFGSIDFGKLAEAATAAADTAQAQALKLSQDLDALSVQHTGKSIGDHASAALAVATSAAQEAFHQADALSIKATGKSLAEHQAVVSEQASRLAAEAGTQLEELSQKYTGESLEGHQASVAKKFTDMGSAGTCALAVGVVNQFSKADEKQRKSLIQLLESSSAPLIAAGPMVLSALTVNATKAPPAHTTGGTTANAAAPTSDKKQTKEVFTKLSSLGVITENAADFLWMATSSAGEIGAKVAYAAAVDSLSI